MNKQRQLQEYDSEPVSYCSRCYSLKIKYEEAYDVECCGDCGCSDILVTSIDEWEAKYQARYGNKFIEDTGNPRNSPIFKMSIPKLKQKVFEHNRWDKIIRKLYPQFPGGLSKADSVILLFNRLIRDNRLDDLRFLLYENTIK